MSTLVHTAILMPDQKWNVVCIDGLATDVVSHFKEILNFGGKIKFQHCGAKNELKFLEKSEIDMTKKFNNAFPSKSVSEKVKWDLYNASEIDRAQNMKFYSTNLYRRWENTSDGSRYLFDLHDCKYSLQKWRDSYKKEYNDPFFCEWGWRHLI